MDGYDVIVVGGGPAGSSCATFLTKSGKKVLLLDRAKFPRDKTCGDGISGRSVRVLQEMEVLDKFATVEHQDMYGVTFSSPNGKVVPIGAPDAGPKKKNKDPPGFVCRREVFDNVLFQNAKSMCTKTIEGFFVTDIVKDGVKVVGVKGTLDGKEMEFRAPVVVGADGAGGIVAKKVNQTNVDDAHQFAGIRAYYENVGGMGDKIELHFVSEAIPGYFWIFPLPNGKANVGIGILVKDMKKRKFNLQKVMNDIIEKNTVFKPRFEKAKRSSDIKSWILPLATRGREMTLYGNGYVLLGDAASLIDPFTGEGIGNALTSGKVAAEVINNAFKKGDFSESVFAEYQKKLFEVIGEEVETNYQMQKVANSKFLLNLIIDKSSRSKDIQGAISNALINPEGHKTLIDPMFILRALLA